MQQYKLEYYDVSRRIVHMNKHLQLETGELLFEKRGHTWALTRFAFNVYEAGDLAEVGLGEDRAAAESEETS